MQPPPRIRVYVDGFNFYYGLFRGVGACPPAHKWLDIVKLSAEICRSQQLVGSIDTVRYFSARSLPGLQDPNQPQRQEVLFRALRGLGNVEIIMGRHSEHPKTVALFGQNGRPQKYPARVLAREEKGSDVNLAAYLVRDAALSEFDLALVLSNDSDLANAIGIAVDDFQKEVYVASPHFRQRVVAQDLVNVATRAFKINTSLLSSCLLPDPAPDHNGTLVSKPQEWT